MLKGKIKKIEMSCWSILKLVRYDILRKNYQNNLMVKVMLLIIRCKVV